MQHLWSVKILNDGYYFANSMSRNIKCFESRYEDFVFLFLVDNHCANKHTLLR